MSTSPQTTNSSLLDMVAANPQLFVDLQEKSENERVTFLFVSIKKFGRIKGVGDQQLDDLVLTYVEFLFIALNESSHSPRASRDSRVDLAAQLFSWFTDRTHTSESVVLCPKIPKTFARLSSEMAQMWCHAQTEEEAQRHLEFIAELYLNTGDEVARQSIKTAMNRLTMECSPDRLAGAVSMLGNMTTWNFGESIFDSIAIGFMRRLLLLFPGAVVRSAELFLALGDASEIADDMARDYTKKLGRIDAAARSLKNALHGAWYIDSIDVAGDQAWLIAKAADIFDVDHDRPFLRGKISDWENPSPGVKLHLRYDLQSELVDAITVE